MTAVDAAGAVNEAQCAWHTYWTNCSSSDARALAPNLPSGPRSMTS